MQHFRIAQETIWMAPMDRGRKTDQENGILYYVWMFGSQDI